MKLNTTFVAIALAFAATSASANVTTPISFVGTAGTFGQAYASAASFTDIFTFSISPSFSADLGADVLVGFNAKGANASLNSFDLYDSSNTQLGAGTIYGGVLASLTYTGLLAGDYYLKVTGSTAKGGSYAGNIDLTLSAVPEPSAWAMMIAGIGMLGFMSVRRRNYF